MLPVYRLVWSSFQAPWLAVALGGTHLPTEETLEGSAIAGHGIVRNKFFYSWLASSLCVAHDASMKVLQDGPAISSGLDCILTNDNLRPLCILMFTISSNHVAIFYSSSVRGF